MQHLTLDLENPFQADELESALRDLTRQLHQKGVEIAPNAGDGAHLSCSMRYVRPVTVLGFRAAEVRITHINVRRQGFAEYAIAVPLPHQLKLIWIVDGV